MTERRLLLGDEAVALGAIHAGLSGVYAYPGTLGGRLRGSELCLGWVKGAVSTLVIVTPTPSPASVLHLWR